MNTFGNIAEDQTLLVEGLKRREQPALKALYNAYGGALNGIILRIVQDENIAKEVLQDVIMKIWDKIDQYDEKKGRLFTWMMQLARNTAKDSFKTKAYSQSSKTIGIDKVVSMVENDNPIESYIEDVGVRRIVASLREEERQVIELVYFQGYTQAAAAKEIPLPLGTVKTRLRMALKHLRKLIDQ